MENLKIKLVDVFVIIRRGQCGFLIGYHPEGRDGKGLEMLLVPFRALLLLKVFLKPVKAVQTSTPARFLTAIDHFFYGFTGAINHAGCWENTRKACKSRAVRRVIYTLLECSPNIPRGLLRQWQRLKEWNYRLPARREIRRAKRRKHFTRRKFEVSNGQAYRKKHMNYFKGILVGKCRDSGVIGFGHHESKRLHVKCASSPDFMDDLMWSANRFNAVWTITFQSLANGIKVSNRTAASKMYSEFIYLCCSL